VLIPLGVRPNRATDATGDLWWLIVCHVHSCGGKPDAAQSSETENYLVSCLSISIARWKNARTSHVDRRVMQGDPVVP